MVLSHQRLPTLAIGSCHQHETEFE
eukprot:SAG11_NODE_29299_length_312_cov_0.971831_1_plen_24_part_10